MRKQQTAMTIVTRRTLLTSGAALGVGVLAGCTRSQQSEGGTASPGGSSAAGGGRFGVGTYNTQEVADELRYIG
jgi:hypothetical protein